jgi:outer membrane protein
MDAAANATALSCRQLHRQSPGGVHRRKCRAAFDQAQQDLIVRVTQAYFSVNVAQDAIAAADAQLAALEQQLGQVTQGVKFGTKATTDVDDTNTRLASARAQRVASLGDLENARSDLQKIMGMRYASLAPLRTDSALQRPVPMDVQAWIDQSRDNNPTVRAGVASLEAARLEVQRAQSEHLPTFDLVASSTHSLQNHNLTTRDDYSTHGAQHQIGVQISVPLFAGGAVVSKIAEARGGLDKTDADLETARRSAASDAQRAFAGVLNGLAQVDALDVAVQSGTNAVKGNEAGFKVGVRTNVDVLNAQQQLFASRRDLSKARYELLLQGVKLKAAAGTYVARNSSPIAAFTCSCGCCLSCCHPTRTHTSWSSAATRSSINACRATSAAWRIASPT